MVRSQPLKHNICIPSILRARPTAARGAEHDTAGKPPLSLLIENNAGNIFAVRSTSTWRVVVALGVKARRKKCSVRSAERRGVLTSAVC